MSILLKLAPILKFFGKCGIVKFPIEKASKNIEAVNILKNDDLIYKGKIKYNFE